jgi:glc operon protein GlcG
MSAWKLATGLALALSAGVASAQMPQYGSNITLDQARVVYTAAEGEARKNNWPVAIAVVDTAGNLVLFQRLENTQTGSMKIAVDKAVSAAIFRRPTKVFQDALAKGGENLRILALSGASPVEGGLPIVTGGKIIGAIGVSGVTAPQDGQIAEAGVKGLSQ